MPFAYLDYGPTKEFPFGLWYTHSSSKAGEWSQRAYDNAEEAQEYIKDLSYPYRWEVRKLVTEPVYETVKPEWKFEVGQRVTKDMPCPPNGTVLITNHIYPAIIDDSGSVRKLGAQITTTWEKFRTDVSEWGSAPKIARIGWWEKDSDD